MKATTTAAATAAILLAALAACSREAGESMDSMDKGATASVEQAEGIGVIKAIDAEARTVKISHDSIPEIGWRAMTMDFAVGAMVDLSELKKGDNVHFMLKRDRDGSYRIPMACRIEGDVAAYKTAMKKMNEGGQGDAMAMTGEEASEGMVMPCGGD